MQDFLPHSQATEKRVQEAKTFLKVALKSAYEEFISIEGETKKRNFLKFQFAIINTIGKKEGQQVSGDQVMA